MNTLVVREENRLTSRRAPAFALVVALALLAAPVLAQHAQPRSGGSGGGGGASHGSSGGSHGGPSGGPSGSHSSGSSAHRYGGGGGGGYSGDGHYSGGNSPHRFPGYGGHDDHHHYGGGYYPYYGYGYGYPYYNYYYPHFSFGFGYYSPYYYGYYGYPYYYGGYGGYYGGGYYGGYYGRPGGYYPPAGYAEGSSYVAQNPGAVALKVKPKTAEVYVDGRYLGPAGSYDGYPGYLWLPPGSYRLELVQDGFANLERSIDVSSGQVLEFKLQLAPGVAARPEPQPEGAYDQRQGGAPPREYEGEGRRDYPPRAEDDRGGPDHAPPNREMQEPRRDGAELVLEVRPDDASVYLDGRFIGTGRDVSTATESLVVDAGEHRIQIVHPDFETEERTVNVKPGEERLVEVTLRHGTGV